MDFKDNLPGNTTDIDRMISTDREFTFRLSPDMVNKSGIFKIYANYVELNSYYYDLNGGDFGVGTVNLSQSDYYITEQQDDKLKVTVSDEYLQVSESVSLFYDDGTFKRDGYVLVEYNTEPDGSGEGYSLGSKFYPGSVGDRMPVLYCIWERALSSSEFTYKPYTHTLPSKAKYADNWNTNGYIITEYHGDSATVTIPEYISGTPVIAIASGAFVDKTHPKR